MRVALISHSARGGDAIGRQIAAKVALLRDHAVDVRLFVETDGGLVPGLAPVASRRLDEAYLGDCDVIVVEYSQHSAALDILPRLTGRKPKIVFDYHGVTPPELGLANHRDALERGGRMRCLAAFADVALAHSDFAARELGANADILGYPVDTAFFTPGPATTRLRKALRLDAGAKLLLFAGRLAPNKRVGTLVDALAHLDADVHAVIVGACGDAYEGERQRVRERAARRGVTARVHFLGRVTDEQLRDAYRSTNVFVMPSIHECFCFPVVEAMACGLPVVAARAAALPETVADAGVTFAPEDAGDLAMRVRHVLTPAIAERLRDAGLKRAAAFAPDVWRTAFLGVVERVLDTPRTVREYALRIRPAPLRGGVAHLRLVNHGELPELAEGPGRTRLVHRVFTAAGKPLGPPVETPLNADVLPGQSAATTLRVAPPTKRGEYVVAINVRRGDADATPDHPDVRLPFMVSDTPAPAATVLVPVELPTEYVDVSEGVAARLKRWVKRSLLNNFQHAFVNVLSRRQSAYNRQVAAAFAELAAANERLRRRNRQLARRLARLESQTETSA